ncbi:hypothetical protein [Actinoplanes sp. L3-i22]|uniref:hypothetical protein n=1 Tax=Actinoplanes sp. L3-i22 TaxID=2836373 RepID=UPI001C759F31|nr:hypothetical protein [Actinoplanes sp. L3-i22]BCY12889.1 hypothetical protein L3i22_079770 [Actinoplanes sp. L3-i22]
MSVDVEVELPRPVSLGAVARETGLVLGELLGGTVVPGFDVLDGDGRPLSGARLDRTLIGERLPPAPDGNRPAIFFDLVMPATGDGVQLMVIDHRPDNVFAIISPYRTCVGVTFAVGLGLATARLTGGPYTDEIRLAEDDETDPEAVIARTRLTAAGVDFAEECERYLRRAPAMTAWPTLRSAAGLPAWKSRV